MSDDISLFIIVALMIMFFVIVALMITFYCDLQCFKIVEWISIPSELTSSDRMLVQ